MSRAIAWARTPRQVAAYIYDAFYSKAAQARNPFRPARIELSRLTVRQYRNAVADLIGSFRRHRPLGRIAGLKGGVRGAGPSEAAAEAAAATCQPRRPGGPVRLRDGQPDPRAERA